MPTCVVFDVGNVLVAWDPRLLYRRLLPDEHAVTEFLATVCTPDWNHAQDLGRPWSEAVDSLAAAHPEHRDLIAAYDSCWEEMVPGEVPGTVAVLESLRAAGVPVYAITNFSVDKWALARRRFAFLGWFDGVVVSGQEGVAKPDEAIFRLALDRFGVRASQAVFVDDSPANVTTAARLGFTAVRFSGAEHLRDLLTRLGLLAPAGAGPRPSMEPRAEKAAP